MICLVGLGNPGKKYENTRHNFGFLALDEFVRVHLPEAEWRLDKKNEAEVIEDSFAGQKLLLIKPQTFMNLSGKAVQSLCQNKPLEIEDIWVIYDDADLDLGVVRLRLGGSAGGHNGVQSVMDSLGGSNFWRVRLGMGPWGNIPLKDFVTMSFTKDEQSIVSDVTKKTADLLAEGLSEGGLQVSSHEID